MPWKTWPGASGLLFPGQNDHSGSKVLYRSKDGKKENLFSAMEWLAAMCSHVPKKEALMSIKGKQMVRYYYYYGNLRRGNR